MSERLTYEEYRAWIDAGSPDELEGWAIILALRARVAKLEDALHVLRDRIWPEDEESFRVIDAALKDAPQ